MDVCLFQKHPYHVLHEVQDRKSFNNSSIIKYHWVPQLSKLNLHKSNVYWFVWTKEEIFKDESIEATGPFEIDSPVMLIHEVEGGLIIKDVWGGNPVNVQEIGSWNKWANELEMSSLHWQERRTLDGIKIRVTALKVHYCATYFLKMIMP